MLERVTSISLRVHSVTAGPSKGFTLDTISCYCVIFVVPQKNTRIVERAGNSSPQTAG